MAAVRTLLVTGASGAGRSTVAAAAAAAATSAGSRTLLLTPDGTELAGGDGPAPHVVRIDPTAAFRDGALDLQSRAGTLFSLLGAPPLDPEELTDLPGAGALALLRALRESGVTGGESAGWDLVVVDLPPVREALGLLALPEQLRRYLRRLLPADRQAARALRPVLAQLAGVPMPAEWAYEAASRADVGLAAVQGLVEDPGTAVALVLEPGPKGGEHLRTARTGLALFGHRLVAVVANRLLPTGSADPFLADLSAHQQDHLKQLAEQCAEDAVPLLELPHLGREPHSADELAEAMAEVAPRSRTGAPERPAEPWSVEDRLAADGHYLWTLPLPGAGREGLDLVRRGDELVVDAGGFRRILPLPAALRRCTVAGAALREGALRVRFTPDPELWPR